MSTNRDGPPKRPVPTPQKQDKQARPKIPTSRPPKSVRTPKPKSSKPTPPKPSKPKPKPKPKSSKSKPQPKSSQPKLVSQDSTDSTDSTEPLKQAEPEEETPPPAPPLRPTPVRHIKDMPRLVGESRSAKREVRNMKVSHLSSELYDDLKRRIQDEFFPKPSQLTLMEKEFREELRQKNREVTPQQGTPRPAIPKRRPRTKPASSRRRRTRRGTRRNRRISRRKRTRKKKRTN